MQCSWHLSPTILHQTDAVERGEQRGRDPGLAGPGLFRLTRSGVFDQLWIEYGHVRAPDHAVQPRRPRNCPPTC